MNLVLQLSTRKGSQVESDGMKFAIQVVHEKNGHECIIQSVGFHNQGLVGNPVCEDWSGSEHFLEKFESGTAFWGEVPCSTFLCESG